VRAAAHHAQAAPVGGRNDFRERLGQIRLGLADRQADPGDDLDRRLEQLVLRFRVFVAVRGRDLGEQVRGRRRQLAGLAVDQLKLPFDAEAGARRRRERDLHPLSIQCPIDHWC
jgi:hypothetical protein